MSVVSAVAMLAGDADDTERHRAVLCLAGRGADPVDDQLRHRPARDLRELLPGGAPAVHGRCRSAGCQRVDQPEHAADAAHQRDRALSIQPARRADADLRCHGVCALRRGSGRDRGGFSDQFDNSRHLFDANMSFSTNGWGRFARATAARTSSDTAAGSPMSRRTSSGSRATPMQISISLSAAALTSGAGAGRVSLRPGLTTRPVLAARSRRCATTTRRIVTAPAVQSS